MSKRVHHNKCKGANGITEVDGKTYCYGRLDPQFDDYVYDEQCERCPRLLANNEEKIDKWIKEQEHESVD